MYLVKNNFDIIDVQIYWNIENGPENLISVLVTSGSSMYVIGMTWFCPIIQPTRNLSYCNWLKDKIVHKNISIVDWVQLWVFKKGTFALCQSNWKKIHSLFEIESSHHCNMIIWSTSKISSASSRYIYTWYKD